MRKMSSSISVSGKLPSLAQLDSITKEEGVKVFRSRAEKAADRIRVRTAQYSDPTVKSLSDHVTVTEGSDNVSVHGSSPEIEREFRKVEFGNTKTEASPIWRPVSRRESKDARLIAEEIQKNVMRRLNGLNK